VRYSGTSIAAEVTLAFSAQTGVHPMIESYPLERRVDAFDRLMSGKARFGVVLIIRG
jgi:propanol-preferring alcohol dehydrogenase